MSEITLEKVDIIRERTGVSYAEAKEALEQCEGEVVDALIYLESKGKDAIPNDQYTTKDEFINWIKELVKKGNVTRIKIKKDDKVLADIPVNAGIAATGVALLLGILTPILAVSFVSVVVAKITVEITKADGTVEVVNKIIKNTVSEVKEKFTDLSGDVIDKVNDITEEVKDKMNKNKGDSFENNVYKYTVKFEEVPENDEEEK